MAHESMSERVRSVGDGLILAFPIEDVTVAGENELAATRLYFFRVSSTTRYFQRYTSLSSINSGATAPTTGYGFLGDSGVDGGSDIFRIETDDWHLMHFGVGPTHPDLQVFYAVSPNANGDPAQDRTGQGEDIVPGTDDRGWFSTEQVSDRFDPPAFTERVSFRNGSNQDGEFLQWAFFNDGNSQLAGNDLDLYFVGGGYKVQPVTNPETQALMLQMALSRPDDPIIDTIIHQVGGINDYTLGSEEPDGWEDVRQEDPGMARSFNVDDLPEPGEVGRGGGRGGGRQVVTRTPGQ